MHQACLSESYFPVWSPVGETVLPGQINWRAFAHRPRALMKRPRGYLQGHTKEVIQMLNENWALSKMPREASNYCRLASREPSLTEDCRTIFYLLHFFPEMRWLFTEYLHLSSFLSPCRPAERKINIHSRPQDFYWLYADREPTGNFNFKPLKLNTIAVISNYEAFRF